MRCPQGNTTLRKSATVMASGIGRTLTDLKESLSGALPEVHGNKVQSHMVVVMSAARCGQMVCPCIERSDAPGHSKNSVIFPPMELPWASGIVVIVASL